MAAQRIKGSNNMSFKITKGILAAGWLPGLGDTLRASGKSIVLMLNPTIGKPLVRIRINSQTAALEVRVHTSTRCTRGSWTKLDSTKVKGYNAAKWAKLAEFWAWRIDQSLEMDRGANWNWANDQSKDENRCGSVANSNSVIPTVFGQGRGRVCKGRPTNGELGMPVPVTGFRLAD